MTTPLATTDANTDALLGSFLARPSHALLLTGEGAITAATMAAVQLLGVTSLENQPYYRAIVPDTQKGSILIEQIRGLLAFFRLKVPGSAAVKRVAILQDAHTLTGDAQNALLKLLEEPPEGSVLILTTTHPQRLLATIRSRLQTIHLQDTQTVPEATAVQLVKQVLGANSYERLLLVDELSRQKEKATTFVTTLATVAMASLEAAARKQSASSARWKTVLEAAYTAEDALLHNGNTKLVLTELMLAL